LNFLVKYSLQLKPEAVVSSSGLITLSLLNYVELALADDFDSIRLLNEVQCFKHNLTELLAGKKQISQIGALALELLRA